MVYNTILIKRRLPGGLAGAPASLSGGELAFNEVDSTLYYGSSAGVISIAGDGAFVNRTSDQTVSGNKTFLGSTTLSSTTFSLDSTLDFGANVLTNLGTPVNDADAATKLYVDDVAGEASTATADLSAEVYNTFVKLTDDRAVDLSGGLTVSSGISADTITTTGNANVGGHLTVTGNLSVLGTQTVVNTETINISGTSTQIDVVNNGTATGVTVNQTGDQDVAEFKDDGNTALIIKGGATDGGYVGIGTATPNEKLTVAGNLSASGTIYGASGLEVSSGGGSTTLYVENGKVGVNTETPNEAFTVIGTISATEDIFARNADFTGTLDVDGATTLGSTLYVTDAATFASSVSAAGAVDFDSTLDVVGATTLQSTLDVSGATVINNSLSATGAVEFDSTLDVVGGVTLSDNLNVAGTSTLTGNVSAGANVYGVAGTSLLVDFIVDGGTF